MRSGSVAVSSFRRQSGEFLVGCQHNVEQRSPRRQALPAPPRRSAHALGQGDIAALRREITGDDAEQRRLTGAVATDEADARAGGQESTGLVEQEALAEAIGDVVEGQHGERGLACFRSVWKRQSARNQRDLRAAFWLPLGQGHDFSMFPPRRGQARRSPMDWVTY
jgi:hypothetical protein